MIGARGHGTMGRLGKGDTMAERAAVDELSELIFDSLLKHTGSAPTLGSERVARDVLASGYVKVAGAPTVWWCEVNECDMPATAKDTCDSDHFGRCGWVALVRVAPR